MKGPYEALGKELLHNGEHFADVITPQDAALVALTLNAVQSVGEAADIDQQYAAALKAWREGPGAPLVAAWRQWVALDDIREPGANQSHYLDGLR